MEQKFEPVEKYKTSNLVQEEKGGIVTREGNLWEYVTLVNFGALISKIFEID
jgi:hypothetical protein